MVNVIEQQIVTAVASNTMDQFACNVQRLCNMGFVSGMETALELAYTRKLLVKMAEKQSQQDKEFKIRFDRIETFSRNASMSIHNFVRCPLNCGCRCCELKIGLQKQPSPQAVAAPVTSAAAPPPPPALVS
jgi:hypothetical protein